MRIFGGERVGNLMHTLGLDDSVPLESPVVSRSLESAQKKVEGHNFDTRKQLVEYDDVMNKHRESVYSRRRRALTSADLRKEIEPMIGIEFNALVTAHTDDRTGIMEADRVLELAAAMLPIGPDTIEMVKKADPRDAAAILTDYARQLYDAREQAYTPQTMRLLERLVYLQVLDRLWIEHLEAMDQLREGIGLRAIGQRDPLVEYKSEGFRLFKRLMSLMEAEIAGTILRAQITQTPVEKPVETALTQAAAQARVTSDTSQAGSAGSDGGDGGQSGGNRAARRAERRAAKKQKTRR
jgi:preprotein translocase subunit SecA